MKARTLALLILLGISTWGRTAVSLFTDLPSVTVYPGADFEVTLHLQITGSEQVESVSYYWEADPQAAGLIEITQRDVADSPISWTFHDDACVTAPPGNILDLINAFNLGGLTDEDPLTSGTWLVAHYTLKVADTLPIGTYILTTYSLPGTGWTTPPPGAQNFPFDQQVSMVVEVVNVIPEPATWFFLISSLPLGLFVIRKNIRLFRDRSLC